MLNKKLIALGFVAIGGTVAIAVASAWAGYKTKEVLDKKKPVGKLNKTKAVAPYYIPVGVALTATIVSDALIFRIGMKEFAAMTATISYLGMNKAKLEEKVKEAVGVDKWREISKSVDVEMAQSDTSFFPIGSIQETGYGNTLCKFHCCFFDIWFRSDPAEVQRAIEEFETARDNEMYLGFVELLDLLHIHLTPELEQIFIEWGWPASSEGCCPGFDKDSPIYIDTDMLEGYVPGYPEDTFVIDLLTPPIECYDQY